MSEQNLSPEAEDAEGHSWKRDDEAEDAEGHSWKRDDEAEDDTEGHSMRRGG